MLRMATSSNISLILDDAHASAVKVVVPPRRGEAENPKDQQSQTDREPRKDFSSPRHRHQSTSITSLLPRPVEALSLYPEQLGLGPVWLGRFAKLSYFAPVGRCRLGARHPTDCLRLCSRIGISAFPLLDDCSTLSMLDQELLAMAAGPGGECHFFV